jgi:hypothetical protein
MSPERINEILERVSELPDTAYVPVAVAAVLDSVCERTIRRTYPVVKLSPGRSGVQLGYLRHRRTPKAA